MPYVESLGCPMGKLFFNHGVPWANYLFAYANIQDRSDALGSTSSNYSRLGHRRVEPPL